MHEIVYKNFFYKNGVNTLVRLWLFLIFMWFMFGSFIWVVNHKSTWLIFYGITVWILWIGVSINVGSLRYRESKLVFNNYPLKLGENIFATLIYYNCNKYYKSQLYQVEITCDAIYQANEGDTSLCIYKDTLRLPIANIYNDECKSQINFKLPHKHPSTKNTDRKVGLYDFKKFEWSIALRQKFRVFGYYAIFGIDVLDDGSGSN